MTIDAIHDFIRDLLDKEQKGWFSPEQIDTVLDRASLWLFNIYQPMYATSQEAQDALSPFKKTLTYATDADGIYTIDAAENYQNLLGSGISFVDADTGATTGRIKFSTEDKVDDRLRSQLRKPTATKPVGLMTGLGQFQLYPAAIYAGTVRFLRRPKAPKYNYTQTGRVITYTSSGSQPLEWAERYQNKIIFKALEFLGLNLGDQSLIEVGEALAKANV